MISLKKLFILLLSMLGMITSIKCEKASHSGFEIYTNDKNPWTHLNLQTNEETIRFAIVSDRTGLPRERVFASALQKLNYLQPDFVMSVGDFIEGYTLAGRVTDLNQIENDWQYIERLTQKLQMPFFYTVGNNDINSIEALPLWQKRFGRTYYHFLYKNALFLILNSDDPPGSQDGKISKSQLQWLDNTLHRYNNVHWTFIFLHRPLWQYEEAKQIWSDIQEILGERPRTVFTGHTTEYKRTEMNSQVYYTLSSTGSGAPPEPPPSPVFDHIMWVTLTDSGPKIANLMLGGIWGNDPVAESKESVRINPQ